MSGSKPLEGQRILVTRPREAGDTLAAALAALGAEPVLLPAISFAPPHDEEALHQALTRLHAYAWIVFTSARGVEAAARRLQNEGRQPKDAIGDARVAAVGPATAWAAQEAGWRVDFQPTAYLTQALAEELPDVEGRRILLLRAEVASADLPATLARRGAEVDDVAAYRTVASEAHAGTEGAADVDWVLFTSPSTVEGLAAQLDPPGLERLRSSAGAACIGPVTAAAARKQGFDVRLVATTHTQEGLVEALAKAVPPHA